MKKVRFSGRMAVSCLAAAAVLGALLLYNHIRVDGSYCFDLSRKYIRFFWVRPGEIHSVSQFVDLQVLAKIAFFGAVGIPLAFAFRGFRTKERWFWLTAAVIVVLVDVLYCLTYSYGVGDSIGILVNFNSWGNCMIGLAAGKGLYEAIGLLCRGIYRRIESSVLMQHSLSGRQVSPDGQTEM